MKLSVGPWTCDCAVMRCVCSGCSVVHLCQSRLSADLSIAALTADASKSYYRFKGADLPTRALHTLEEIIDPVIRHLS